MRFKHLLTLFHRIEELFTHSTANLKIQPPISSPSFSVLWPFFPPSLSRPHSFSFPILVWSLELFSASGSFLWKTDLRLCPNFPHPKEKYTKQEILCLCSPFLSHYHPLPFLSRISRVAHIWVPIPSPSTTPQQQSYSAHNISLKLFLLTPSGTCNC